MVQFNYGILHILKYIAGCSPCGCGVIEACPGYLDPYWYIALIVTVIVSILLLFVYIFIKPKPKLLRNIMVVCMIVAIAVSSFVAYITITGNIESEKSSKAYEKCLEDNNNRGLNSKDTIACEF